MARRGDGGGSWSCGICEGCNLRSICAGCINHELLSCYSKLVSSRLVRDALRAKLAAKLEAKKLADEQRQWRIAQNERVKRLRDQLCMLKKQISYEKSKFEEGSEKLKARRCLLDPAYSTVQKRHRELKNYYSSEIDKQNFLLMSLNTERLHCLSIVIKQIVKLFPMRRKNIEDGDNKEGYTGLYDQICNVRLPRGLDPHSVPPEELSAALGYMMQLLNLVVPALAAPCLHISGFAGSCSRIWQRDSYWDTQPSSHSKDYPLFIPRHNICPSGPVNSWAEKSASNFTAVSSVELDKKQFVDLARSSSFSYSATSAHSTASHKELQRGISLLKKSVACITAYCSNYFCFEIHSEASTFDAFAGLLAFLSSSRAVRSLSSVKGRSDKLAQQENKAVWDAASTTSTYSNVLDSMYMTKLPTSRCDTSVLPGQLKRASLEEEWDIVEHPTLPPPPSEVEDVEHWSRAMFTDAKK